MIALAIFVLIGGSAYGQARSTEDQVRDYALHTLHAKLTLTTAGKVGKYTAGDSYSLVYADLQNVTGLSESTRVRWSAHGERLLRTRPARYTQAAIVLGWAVTAIQHVFGHDCWIKRLSGGGLDNYDPDEHATFTPPVSWTAARTTGL